MAGDEKLRKLLEATIQKEIKRQLQALLPTMVKEAMMNVMSGLITEGIQKAQTNGNRPPTNTRTKLQESLATMLGDEDVDAEMARFQGKRRAYASMVDPLDGIGEGFSTPDVRRSPNLILPDAKIHQQSGQPIAINPDEVPDHLIEAFNKDYSKDMKSMKIG